MMFILVLCNTTLKSPYGGMSSLASYPFPLSAQPLKWALLSSLSGLLWLVFFYHFHWPSHFPCPQPSPVRQCPQMWYMSSSLVICFQAIPLPMSSSRQLHTLQPMMPLTLLKTWSLDIIWRFLLALCLPLKFLVLLLIPSGSFSFRIGCLTILRTSAHLTRNKVSHAQNPQYLPHHLSFLELLVLSTSSAQELCKSQVQPG